MTQNIYVSFWKKMAYTFTVHCDYIYACLLMIN